MKLFVTILVIAISYVRAVTEILVSTGRTGVAPYYEFNNQYILPTLVRGQQYKFKENGVGSSHPFSIGTGSRTYKIGEFPLRHNTQKSVTITVPSSGKLYYWCENHNSMTQEFVLTEASSKCSGNTNSAEDVTCDAGTALKSGSDTIDKNNDAQSNCCTKKILCLHGGGQTSNDFKGTDGMQSLESELSEFEFVYAQAPNNLNLWMQDPPGGKDDPTTATNWADNELAVITNLLDTQGPFNIILGYSQGAAFIPVVLASNSVNTFDKAVMFAGYLPTTHQGLISNIDAAEPFGDIPALVWSGEYDYGFKGLAPALAKIFTNPVSLHSSAGGHDVPSSTDATFNNIVNFIRDTTPPSDTTAPTISISGVNPLTIEAGTAYNDAGATCTDVIDGQITPTSNSTVNLGVPNTYDVTYKCVDSSGNEATATRTVIVVGISGKCRGNTNSAEDVTCDAGTVLKDNPNLISHNNDKQNNCCVAGQEITFDNQVKTYTICSGESARITWGGYHNVCELPDQTTFENPPASNDICDSGTERHTFEDAGTVKTLSNLWADLGQTRYFICSKHPSAKFKVTCPQTCAQREAQYNSQCLDTCDDACVELKRDYKLNCL